MSPDDFLSVRLQPDVMRDLEGYRAALDLARSSDDASRRVTPSQAVRTLLDQPDAVKLRERFADALSRIEAIPRETALDEHRREVCRAERHTHGLDGEVECMLRTIAKYRGGEATKDGRDR